MALTYEKFGKIDVLINNAATFIFGHIKGKNKGTQTNCDR